MARRLSRRTALGLALAGVATPLFAQDQAAVRRELAGIKTRMDSALLREEWQEVERVASRVIEIADTRALKAKGYADRALAYGSTQRGRRALEEIEQAIQLDPDKAEWVARRGDIYLLLNRRQDAVNDYEAALARDPNDFGARQGLLRLGVRR